MQQSMLPETKHWAGLCYHISPLVFLLVWFILHERPAGHGDKFTNGESKSYLYSITMQLQYHYAP